MMFEVLCDIGGPSACFVAGLRVPEPQISPQNLEHHLRTQPREILVVEVLYVTQWFFRAVNRPSGPDFMGTATRKEPKSATGRPQVRRKADFGAFLGTSPAKIQPGRMIYGPDTAQKH